MASRYWVGGTAPWNTSTARWSATDGGAPGASVPGSSDDVFFTALSGARTVTWTSGSSTTVRSINCTGFTGTHATGGLSKTLNSTGTVWTSPATCTITGAPTLTVSSTGSTAISVTCNHASPSATNAPNFSFTGGTYALTLSGTGFRALTFTGSSCTASGSISMYQNLTLSSGGTFTSLAPTFLDSASVTSVGKTLGNTTVNTAAGTVTLADAMTAGTTNTTTLTAGTLALANFTLSTGIFSSSGSSTRAITFGSGNIALTSTTAATTVLSMATATNFTWTGTGGFTRNMAATATMVFGTTDGTTSNAPNLTVNAGSSALTITSGSYFKNVVFTGSTSTVTATSLNVAGNLTLASGGTYTSVVPTFRASGTLTSNGKTLGTTTVNGSGITVTLADAATVSVLAQNFTLTQGTINLAGFTLTAPRFSSSGSNTRAINFGSGGGITLTSNDIDLFRMDTATNFTWSGTGGITLTGGGGNGRFDFGTTAGATSSNVLDLTITTAAGLVVQFALGSSVRSINCPSGNPSLETISGTTNLYGNLTLIAGVGSNYPFSPTFLASATVTSNGKTLRNFTVNGTGITVTLADAMTLGASNTLTLTQGTFTAANFNVTAGLFSSSNSNTRTLNMGSGTWTISGSGATAWNTATTTGFTVVPSTSTISMTSASAKTFAGGGLTYYNLNQGGAGALTISGSNTFNNITNSTQPATVTFTAGTTQTVSNFSLSGTAGNLITIDTTSAGVRATLSKSSGTVDAQYLSIKDSNATGGAVWNSLLTNGNVDNGNNTGWIFAPPGNMFLVFT